MNSDHEKSAREEHGAPMKRAPQAMPAEGHEGMHGDIEAMAEDTYSVLGDMSKKFLMVLSSFRW